MRLLRANAFLANRGERLGCFVFDSRPPSGGRVRTAPDAPLPASGAGVLLTQGSAVVEARAAHNREVAGSTPAPATRSVSANEVRSGQVAPDAGTFERGESAPAGSVSDAIPASLSDASAFILSLVAAHQGRSPEDILATLIAAAAEAIGIHELIVRDAGEVDLAELPGFARRAANRFRGGGP